MANDLDYTSLTRDAQAYTGTGGRCQENAEEGFVPAFKDTRTGCVYLARNRSGSVAAVHVLEGLPDAVVRSRDASGKITAVAGSLVAGFVRGGRFLTRAETAAWMSGHRED